MGQRRRGRPEEDVTEQADRSESEQALASAELEAAAEAAADRSDAIEAHPGPQLAAQPAPQPAPGVPDEASVVRAGHVELSQGGAARIEATSVNLTQGGASRISARDVSITMGGAALVRTDSLRLEENAGAFAVVSRRAQLASGSRVFVLISRQTTGDVRPVLDWRSALAAAAGYVVLRRLLGRRRR